MACSKIKITNLLNRRYTNVYSSEFIFALEEVIKHHILPDIQLSMSTTNLKYLFDLSELKKCSEEPSDLAIFLLRFFGIKSKDENVYNQSIEEKGDLVQNWMYHYSDKKFTELLRVFEFRILFQHAFNCHLKTMLHDNSILSFNNEKIRGYVQENQR